MNKSISSESNEAYYFRLLSISFLIIGIFYGLVAYFGAMGDYNNYLEEKPSYREQSIEFGFYSFLTARSGHFLLSMTLIILSIAMELKSKL